MRITGPKQGTNVSSKPKTTAGSGARGAFSVADGAGTSSSKGAPSVRALTTVDALISIQEVPDATARRAKAIGRAQDMLDLLEEIKIAILSGALPRARVTKLTRVVQHGRDEIADTELSTVLDEIELRAKVELAKLEKAA